MNMRASVLVALCAAILALTFACSSGGGSSSQAPTAPVRPTPNGPHFQGGSSPVIGHLIITLPVGTGGFIIGEFKDELFEATRGERGTQAIEIYRIASGSRLWISRDDGHEFQRVVTDAADDGVFDAIVQGIHAAPTSR